MHVELIYFEGCPHAADARRRLREACDSLGVKPEWTEWESSRVTTPSHLRHYASPTILVDGRDVEGKPHTSGAGCAVGGGPSLEVLRRALMGTLS